MAQPYSGSSNGGKALISLGSNVTSRHGTPRETVAKALVALGEEPLRRIAQSALYLTPFVPAGMGADVVNAAALVQTELSPRALLDHLHAIEARFARTRTQRWVDRTLDLDLIAVGGRVCPDAATVNHWIGLEPDLQKRFAPDELVLPHPRLQDRAFVLVPAADVWPDWVHPLLAASIAEMRDGLPPQDVADVKRLAG